MAFEQSAFLALPQVRQAKKCADMLRTATLRLGNDWKQTLATYNQLAEWLQQPERKVDLLHLTVVEVRSHYLHWRTLAGLPLQRDMEPLLDPSDRAFPLSDPLDWWVLAHNLRSAYNAGSVIRTCDCFGLAGVWFSGHTPDKDHPGVLSSAMCAGQWVAFRRSDSPLVELQKMRGEGRAVVALELTDSAIPIQEFAWPEHGVLMLGNEESGVADEFLALATHQVCIPMHGRKGSLNVASAFAVAAAQLRCSLPRTVTNSSFGP